MRRPDPDRRIDPRKPVALTGLVVAPGVEQSCRIVDVSSSGYRIRLDRPTGVPSNLILIDVAAGQGVESQIVWTREGEIGLKAISRASLAGLTPSRFATARAAWLRVTGRS